MPVFDQERDQEPETPDMDVIEQVFEGLYDQKTLEWRRDKFAELGMTEEWASFFASSRTDYHRAEAIVAMGYSLDTALTLVAGYTATGEVDPNFDWSAYDKLGVTVPEQS